MRKSKNMPKSYRLEWLRVKSLINVIPRQTLHLGAGLGAFVLYLLHLHMLFRPSDIFFISTYYPIYILALGFIFFNKEKLVINKNVVILSGLSLALAGLAAINMAFFDQPFNRRLIFTWPAWVVMLFFIGYTINTKDAVSKLAAFAKVIIIIQVILCVMQLFNSDVFDAIWASQKLRGLDRDVKVAGSTPSPIISAILWTYLVIFISVRQGPKKEIFWVLLVSILIMMSGSRTMILVYPLTMGAWYFVESNKISILVRLRRASFFTFFLYLFQFLILFLLRDTLIYSAHLIRLLPIETVADYFHHIGMQQFSLFLYDLKMRLGMPSHGAITAVVTRQEIWVTTFSEFSSKGFLEQLIGSNKYTFSTAHQDYLFMLTRYGLTGLFIYMYFFYYLMRLAYENRQLEEARVTFLVCLIILGTGTINTIGSEIRVMILTAISAGFLLHKLMIYNNKLI